MRGFLLGFILTIATFFFSGSVFALSANPLPYSQASASCEAWAASQNVYFKGQGSLVVASCPLVASPGPIGACPNLSYQDWKTAQNAFQMKLSDGRTFGSDGWCVRQSCSAGETPDGTGNNTYGYDAAVGSTHPRDGCCYKLHLWQAGKLVGGGPDDGYSQGYWVSTGAQCEIGVAGAIAMAPPKPVSPPDRPCEAGKMSCINPDRGACAESESGEWFCEPVNKPDPGGCATGATGTLCIGKDGQPAPPPPDPPISKGTPPDGTNQYQYTDSDGNVTNITENHYSGTSPGSSSSSSDSSSPGGTGSNASGSGNSGSNGSDQNGKCQDGSVPTASGCSGTYRDDGCDTPPACHGDAVMCGIAANTHKTACEVAAASGGSAGGPPSGMGDGTDNSGDPAGSSVSNSVDLGDGSNLDGGGFGFASTCPLTDGIHFDFLGKSISVDTSDMCTPLGFIYYIVLAFAYFAAAKIIAGVK